MVKQANPEQARLALLALSEEEAELLLEVLDDALGRPRSRVRAPAHRLRQNAPAVATWKERNGCRMTNQPTCGAPRSGCWAFGGDDSGHGASRR
jgi:hypothetical protein